MVSVRDEKGREGRDARDAHPSNVPDQRLRSGVEARSQKRISVPAITPPRSAKKMWSRLLPWRPRTKRATAPEQQGRRRAELEEATTRLGPARRPEREDAGPRAVAREERDVEQKARARAARAGRRAAAPSCDERHTREGHRAHGVDIDATEGDVDLAPLARDERDREDEEGEDAEADVHEANDREPIHGKTLRPSNGPRLCRWSPDLAVATHDQWPMRPGPSRLQSAG